MIEADTQIQNKFIRMSFLETSFKFIHTAAYDIKFTKRWRWIEEICLRFLRKTGCASSHFDREQVVKSVCIPADKAAIDIILLAEGQLRTVGERPNRIVIGRKQFEEIVSSEMPLLCRNFSFEINITQSSRYTRMTRFGVPVDVIPWMDGVLVI